MNMKGGGRQGETAESPEVAHTFGRVDSDLDRKPEWRGIQGARLAESAL